MSLQLCEDRKGPTLSVLYDTCAALTSGYLSHHLVIKEQCPHVVHSYETFNGDNPFDPIKLLGAISNPSEYDPEKHGMLSAVIRYKTPYQDRHGNRLLLPVTLGESMAINTILGNTVFTK